MHIAIDIAALVAAFWAGSKWGASGVVADVKAELAAGETDIKALVAKIKAVL